MYTGGVRCRVQRWRRQGRRSHGAVRAQLLACSSGRLRQTPVYVRLKGGKDRFHRIAGRHIFLRSTIPPHILVCDLRSGLVGQQAILADRSALGAHCSRSVEERRADVRTLEEQGRQPSRQNHTCILAALYVEAARRQNAADLKRERMKSHHEQSRVGARRTTELRSTYTSSTTDDQLSDRSRYT